MLIRRILMNAQDTSPGTGAPSTSVTPAPAPAVTPAPQSAPAPQPAPAQGAFDKASLVREIVDEVKKSFDGAFATLRRAGALPNKSAPTAAPNTDATTTPTPTTVTAPTVDPTRYRELDRAVTRAGMAETLSGTAYKRLERAFADENPIDAESWVADYFEGMGLKRGAAAPATAVTTTTATPTAAPAAAPAPVPSPAPATAIPVTDRGSPPPPTRPLEERSLYEMSEADRQEFISRHGPTKYAQKLMSDGKGRRTLLG
jgi:type VI secretion system secreted protein VgrG